jgi:hypothetical protein
MLNYFALGSALWGLVVCLRILWLVRTSPVPEKVIVDEKLLAYFLFYLALGLLGCGYHQLSMVVVATHIRPPPSYGLPFSSPCPNVFC